MEGLCPDKLCGARQTLFTEEIGYANPLSHLALLDARFPLLSPAVTSSPGRGKSFLSGGAFRHLAVSRAKPPPFGGGGIAVGDDGEGSSRKV